MAVTTRTSISRPARAGRAVVFLAACVTAAAMAIQLVGLDRGHTATTLTPTATPAVGDPLDVMVDLTPVVSGYLHATPAVGDPLDVTVDLTPVVSAYLHATPTG